jgi:hypothetical protein
MRVKPQLLSDEAKRAVWDAYRARKPVRVPLRWNVNPRRILESGIMEGGRFILQEGNNLPPCVPLENLEAVYATCQEFGRYPNGR